MPSAGDSICQRIPNSHTDDDDDATQIKFTNQGENSIK